MSKCVIVGGAPVENYELSRGYLSTDDFVIYCDCGLRHREGLGAEPDLIVGDFDSHPAPGEVVEIITLPREKDDTDTMYAVKEAIRRGYDDFLLLGMVGKRLDHSLGNVSILLYLDSVGKHGKIVDDYSEMEIVANKPHYVTDNYLFFSLLNISGTADGVIIKNAKYPLDNASITCEFQYGISNEVLKGQTAEISVKSGRLLLIRIISE